MLVEKHAHYRRIASFDYNIVKSVINSKKKMTYEATDTKTPEQSFKMDVRDYRNSIPRTKRNPGVNAMKYDTGTYGDSPYRRKAISDSYISKQRNAYRKTAIDKCSRW